MWVQLAAFGLAVWLTAAPGALGYCGPARPNDHVFGPLAATVALVAVFEVTRGVRWLNLPIGLWLAAAPWVLGYGTTELLNSTVVGLLLAASAWVGGRREESFGGGWRALWDPHAAPGATP